MLTDSFKNYLQSLSSDTQGFGFNAAIIAQIEPLLAFLYEKWWRVDMGGLNNLPDEGPALIVGNSGGVLPWPALMLLYALMSKASSPRRLNILCDMDWIADERLYGFLTEIGFVSYSSANAKELWAQNELVAVFPEGISGMTKAFSQRYRVSDFDWTKLLPAVESGVKIYPLACVGCDEAHPVLSNFKQLAGLLKLPSFPLTPFFPWLPYPLSLLLSFPVKWQMRVLKPAVVQTADDREQMQNQAKNLTRHLEGEIQAELNRLLRTRIKAI